MCDNLQNFGPGNTVCRFFAPWTVCGMDVLPH